MNVMGLVLNIVCAVIAITFFEFFKSLTATILGDDTPKKNGRLTLNPLSHIEIIGFVLMLYMGYGWGKPVEVRAGNFKDRKRGIILTYIIPIIISLVIAEALTAICKYIEIDSALFIPLINLAKYFAGLSIINIIPVYPFCGSYILRVCINPNTAIKYAQIEKTLQIIVIFILLLGFGTDILNNFVVFLLGW